MTIMQAHSVPLRYGMMPDGMVVHAADGARIGAWTGILVFTLGLPEIHVGDNGITGADSIVMRYMAANAVMTVNQPHIIHA
ncbi:hypothetical protein MSKU15_0770 [Komagataeibacter diospyri]|uniref:hypothetical protein n=1 Tax=Komagataeibacter diospyri TaxID=1932662 RepID=UPI0011374E54|nr:hypothetical protein [Komagataeibacter diospyri]GCE89169.1 hypothetical protein MSKU15_0770 [Komagataeibacter diospyri]